MINDIAQPTNRRDRGPPWPTLCNVSARRHVRIPAKLYCFFCILVVSFLPLLALANSSTAGTAVRRPCVSRACAAEVKLFDAPISCTRCRLCLWVGAIFCAMLNSATLCRMFEGRTNDRLHVTRCAQDSIDESGSCRAQRFRRP